MRIDPVEYLKTNPFVLAPMAGITDCAFRSFMRSMGAGVVVTELVSATGLKYSSEKTRRIMKIEEGQRPVGIQLFGEEIDHLKMAALEVEQMGADFVDLNFGCPVPKVVKKGAGAATLKDLKYLRDVLRAVKSSVSIPVTIKVRTGWDSETRNTEEVCQIAYDEGMSWVAIHGRTRAQGYEGRADWDYIAEVKSRSKIPVLGNGDIHTAKQAVERLKTSGVDGVLIGRGALKNPWIFNEAQRVLREQELVTAERDFTGALTKLIQYQEQHVEQRAVMLQVKKFSAWFSAGYPNSSQFRKSLFSVQDKNELLDITFGYFEGLKKEIQSDTSHEAFLMGGHG